MSTRQEHPLTGIHGIILKKNKLTLKNHKMKNIINIFSLLFLSIILFSCGNQKSETAMNNNNANQPQFFTTPDEAAKKGRSDLLSILKTNKDINLNIDAGKLENSQPGKLLKHVEIDFNKLIKTDSVSSLSQLSGSELNTLAPFVTGNEIAGIVEINKTPKGWEVAGLGNKNVTDDINEIGRTLNQSPANMDITVYEVPNLQILIYSVKNADVENYFMNYDKNNLKEAVSIQNFYPMLKEKSVAFERNFGDLVKKQKLVK